MRSSAHRHFVLSVVLLTTCCQADFSVNRVVAAVRTPGGFINGTGQGAEVGRRDTVEESRVDSPRQNPLQAGLRMGSKPTGLLREAQRTTSSTDAIRRNDDDDDEISIFEGSGAALNATQVDPMVYYGVRRDMTRMPFLARIINGVEVSPPDKYPFMVGIVGVRVTSSGQEQESFRCGGTIISPFYVLSASHCYFTSGTTSSVSGVFQRMRVRVGAHDIDNPELEVDVAEIIGNPNYVGSTFENDISVLRLTRPVDPEQFPPVQLSWEPEMYEPGTAAVVMGWGSTGAQGLSKTLMQADVPVVSRETCTQPGSYPGPPETSLTVTPVMVCAGYAEGGIDACQGDSGGPLIALPPSGEQPVQIGIVSWGEGCALPGKYGVYADVRQLRAFIIRHVPDIQTWSPFPEDTTGFFAPEPSPPPPSPFSFLSMLSL